MAKKIPKIIECEKASPKYEIFFHKVKTPSNEQEIAINNIAKKGGIKKDSIT